MLSVVLYGRNDSHGYNLHKRGAISLNAIAHLLRDPEDELIFVDYNTPDDLPTFPEAIADTLTPHARECLRILRVRPSQHARFAANTHLVALEPIARNVAVRRSNPANAWVLSTNTDMVFVPREGGASLGELVGGLDDGFYHLPRFELPEALWESLDRADAAGIIASVGEWGERFHLDEVVRSGGDNLFDGPGDFQLFRRDDLLAIGGFDERMLKGWHVDANIARRMRFLKGEVRSAEALLRGYHCDHTRQASPYHKGDRVENDPVRFVDGLQTAELAEQMQSFGLAGEEVEEVRLGDASAARYLKGIAAAVPAGRSGALQTAYVPEAYGALAYPPEHVLPYLLDLVSCIPQDARIGYLGARLDAFEAFAEGWKAMGGSIRPLHPAEAAWLGGGSTPLEEWAEAADVFVFEVGAETATVSADLNAEERSRLWLVNRGMAVAFASDERRQRQGASARRAIVVNAIHSSFEAQLFRHLSVTLTPFSSRIRHGFIVDPERAPVGHPAFAEAAKALGRKLPVGPLEAAFCLTALEASLKANSLTPEARSLAGPLAALTAARAPGFPAPGDAASLLDKLATGRAKAADFPVGVSSGGGAEAANRLARLEDWSDPAFLRMAYALFPNRRHDDPAERIAWTWERVSLALNLDAALPLAQRPKVLVAAELPELLAFMLSNLGARVDIADPRALAQGRFEAVDWRAELIEKTFAVPSSAEPVGVVSDQSAELAAGLRYDAVLLPQNALFAAGRDGAAALLHQASELLKPGGHLGLAAFGLINDVEPAAFGDNLTADLVRDGRWAVLMGERVGLAPFGGIEPSVTAGTLDTLPPEDGAGSAAPALVIRDGPALRIVCTFAFTLASANASDADWEVVNQAIRTGFLASGERQEADARLPLAELQRLQALAAASAGLMASGSVLRRLTAGSGVERTPRAVRVPSENAAQLFLSGAVGRLSPGAYDLRVQGSGPGAALQAFVITPDGVAATAPVQFDDGEWLLSFEATGPVANPVAIALHTQGGAEVEILEVAID